jgi:cytochrome c-type biogenesis protein CcmH
MPGMPAAVQRAEIAERVRTDPDSLSEGELLVHLAETARANPTDPQPHLFSGMLYLRAGAFPQAQLSYEAALRRDPTLAEAYLGLGRAIVASEEGDIGERAQAMFAEAARLDPSALEPLFYLAWAAEERTQADAAARWTALMAATDQAPVPIDSLRAMGREAVQARGEISPFALKLFGELKRRAPADPLPWFYEALAASSADKFPEAERLWGEVLERLPPEDPRRAMATQMRADAAARRRPQAPPT